MTTPVVTLRYRVERSIIDDVWLVLDPAGDVVVECSSWAEAFDLARLVVALSIEGSVSAKHADPEYRKNARIIRGQVAKRRRASVEVHCWRCGNEIDPEQSYDVGHIDPAGGHALDNLGPEHRYKQGHRCQGNRAAGGRMGRAIQTARTTTTKGLLPW